MGKKLSVVVFRLKKKKKQGGGIRYILSPSSKEFTGFFSSFLYLTSYCKPKRKPTHAGLAWARGLRSDVCQHILGGSTTLMRLHISSLFMCGDIQLNLGPKYKYPGGICAKPVKINQQGIQYDFHDVWHHIRCMNIAYEALAKSSCVWGCNKCDVPDYSSSLLNWSSDTEHPNGFCPINTDKFPGP